MITVVVGPDHALIQFTKFYELKKMTYWTFTNPNDLSSILTYIVCKILNYKNHLGFDQFVYSNFRNLPIIVCDT